MRPHYKMASHAIHPNARALFFDLGLDDEENLMLAGPSTRGLADPGMGATIALYQATVSLLNERPDIDELVTMLVLERMVPVIEDALLEANDAHDAEADRRRAERDDFTPGIPADTPPTRFQRLFALISDEAPREAIDLYVRREDAERELREILRDEPEWVDVLRVDEI